MGEVKTGYKLNKEKSNNEYMIKRTIQILHTVQNIPTSLPAYLSHCRKQTPQTIAQPMTEQIQK